MSHRDRKGINRPFRNPQPRSKHSPRSRSPLSHCHKGHTSARHRGSQHLPLPITLPYGASPLRKRDFELYKPMFGLYLDIQKHKILEELPGDEVKGRWKSFMGKWNRGELAEGWYLQKVQASARNPRQDESVINAVLVDRRDTMAAESDEDEPGPALPAERAQAYGAGTKSRPAIPNMQDLELQRESRQEDAEARREDLRYERKVDRKAQKESLDELVPRAEAGSKDRQLERKRENAESNRVFAATKTEGGGVADVPDKDLFGDDEGIVGFRKRKAEMERKKNERELRKEEILRARADERGERLRVHRQKEAQTMEGLVALAKARFG